MLKTSGRDFSEDKESFVCEYWHDTDVYFVGEINPFSAHCLRRTIKGIERDKEDLAEKNINLYITSPGGSVTDGLKLHDAIAMSPLNVTVIAEGFVASAATLLLCATADSKIMPNTFLLFHEVSASFELTYSNLHPHLNYLDHLMTCVVNIYNKKLKTPIDKEMLRKDWILNSQEAIDLGLVSALLENH